MLSGAVDKLFNTEIDCVILLKSKGARNAETSQEMLLNSKEKSDVTTYKTITQQQ